MNPFPPNLTASALFEIVKDVPKEAWPTHLRIVDGWWWYRDPVEDIASTQIPTDIAAHAFNGAMTAWYLGKCGGTLKSAHLMVRQDGLHSIRRTEDSDSDGTGATLLEALAAACREGK